MNQKSIPFWSLKKWLFCIAELLLKILAVQAEQQRVVLKMPGKPDIVLPKYKTVIFVNGCFWHKHNNCKYFVWPKTNESFWKNKILSNVERMGDHLTNILDSIIIKDITKYDEFNH